MIDDHMIFTGKINRVKSQNVSDQLGSSVSITTGSILTYFIIGDELSLGRNDERSSPLHVIYVLFHSYIRLRFG